MKKTKYDGQEGHSNGNMGVGAAGRGGILKCFLPSCAFTLSSDEVVRFPALVVVHDD